MKVIKATDYGFRKVIVVALNDTEDECIHPDGSHVCVDVEGKEIAIPEGKQCWEVCHQCRYNWRTREFIFQGNKLFYMDNEGYQHEKTDEMMLEEIRAALKPVHAPRKLASLEGVAL